MQQIRTILLLERSCLMKWFFVFGVLNAKNLAFSRPNANA